MTSYFLAKESAEKRRTIRQNIRQKRRSLSCFEQSIASQYLLEQLQKHSLSTEARTVALYLAVDGELDVTPIIEWYWRLGKTVCLPVLHPFSDGHLLFLKYSPNTIMVPNQYQIKEPRLLCSDIVPVNDIDIIFTPLVAFDEHGQRLGMGGGYYDRTLSFCQPSPNKHAIGLAHECQQVSTLPAEAWDIPLRTIITPSKIWRWA